MLPHLPDGFTTVVTGASGGIGGAIIDALIASGRPARIVAVSRELVSRDDPRVESVVADITSAEGLEALSVQLAGAPVHLLFNAIGLLHDQTHGIAPEKRLDDLDGDSMSALLQVNAVTPVLLLKALQPNLKGRHPVLVASLSARVGSIGDNHLGGWYGYRASKAAHNMLMKTAAIELKRLNPQLIVTCLHPGTTDTRLSQPFQSRVPTGKLFTPAFVAERLLAVLGEREISHSGRFYDWAGDEIPW
ncbi:SDR family NAD(P)-dependent oxidoreductase [Halomonas urumqiensis]|uniref:Short-chain dehydrogenase n=1 Tax=Halomonas urumqiensis TaxID=1684789 RepID=A0A2N7UDQ0_9GAMM|nr:SDR family NAD(P)-dependent oxidoreductase [Halomonas urumqiensis]PMR78547.1 short-chain dehydrogenase [Halomonas urumqiensis]PTB03692.1 KR domain-containing protein [Halomonas urumqiensis]GHE20093.1 short-chain dehydrogenase [Halomonas urumqiensis]